MNRPARMAVITTGLVGAGAIFGAVAGTVALAVSLIIDGIPSLVGAALLGAYFGAPLGAVAAPILGWSLLRRVPLGRMFIVCAAGTVMGGVVGWLTAGSDGDIMVGGLAGAAIGCVVAAFNLWYRTRGESHGPTPHRLEA
jgi:hypothetical protein